MKEIKRSLHIRVKSHQRHLSVILECSNLNDLVLTLVKNNILLTGYDTFFFFKYVNHLTLSVISYEPPVLRNYVIEGMLKTTCWWVILNTTPTKLQHISKVWNISPDQLFPFFTTWQRGGELLCDLHPSAQHALDQGFPFWCDRILISKHSRPHHVEEM